MVNLDEAIAVMERFAGASLRTTISSLEASLRGAQPSSLGEYLSRMGATRDALAGALEVKSRVGEVNVVIHALGILTALPFILEPAETIEYVSLGAGNTGRPYDLETDRRVAEFKFISWRGGPESIRQNSLFKDFYLLAEAPTFKTKQLYVVDDGYPLKFFRGGRAMTSILSRNNKLRNKFFATYGEHYPTVGDYFRDHASEVEIVDLNKIAPETFHRIGEVLLPEADGEA